MLPRTAIPSAPPSSELVSDKADAAPALYIGALPTIRSVVRITTGDMPSEYTMEATRSSVRLGLWPSRDKRRNPKTDKARPPLITRAEPNRRATLGTSKDPTMYAHINGTVQRPASRGDRPSTS